MLNPKPSNGRRTLTVRATRPKRGEEPRDILKRYTDFPNTARAKIAELLSHETRATMSQASRDTRNVEGATNKQILEQSVKKRDIFTNSILNLIHKFNENIIGITNAQLIPSQVISFDTNKLLNRSGPFKNTIGKYIINLEYNRNLNANELMISYYTYQDNIDYPLDTKIIFRISFPIHSWKKSTKSNIIDELNKIPIRFLETFKIKSIYLNFNKYYISYDPQFESYFYKGPNTRITINKPLNEFIVDINNILSQERASSGESNKVLEKIKKSFANIVEFNNNFITVGGRGKRKPLAK